MSLCKDSREQALKNLINFKVLVPCFLPIYGFRFSVKRNLSSPIVPLFSVVSALFPIIVPATRKTKKAKNVFVRMYERVLFGEVVSDNVERKYATC